MLRRKPISTQNRTDIIKLQDAKTHETFDGARRLLAPRLAESTTQNRSKPMVSAASGSFHHFLGCDPCASHLWIDNPVDLDVGV